MKCVSKFNSMQNIQPYPDFPPNIEPHGTNFGPICNVLYRVFYSFVNFFLFISCIHKITIQKSQFLKSTLWKRFDFGQIVRRFST